MRSIMPEPFKETAVEAFGQIDEGVAQRTSGSRDLPLARTRCHYTDGLCQYAQRLLKANSAHDLQD
jgi:hypothetical protein